MNTVYSIALEDARQRFPDRFSIAWIVVDEIGLGVNSALAAFCVKAYQKDQITEDEICTRYSDQVFRLGLAKDIRVVLIRMAEILHDIRIVEQLPKGQSKRLAEEARNSLRN